MENIKIEETINQRIVRYRKIVGYSQAELADMLSMKRSTYSQKERGGDIDCETIIKISEILGVDVKVLLYGENLSNRTVSVPQLVTNTQERRMIEAIRYMKPKYKELIYEMISALLRSN